MSAWDNILAKLDAEYQEARDELGSSMPRDGRKPGYIPIHASGKKSGLLRAMQIVRAVREGVEL